MKRILHLSSFIIFAAHIISAQGYWSQRFAQVGTNNNVPQSFAVDGSGNVYIGGGFDYAFGVKTNFFAKWNPQQGWDSIPGKFYGSSFPISSIAAGSGNDIYVAGGFSGVGALAKKGIVKWNGTKWDSIPGAFSMGNFTAPTRIVYAGGKLYAIGTFTKAGTLNVKGIAVWDGTKWDSLGSLKLQNSNQSVINKAFTVTPDGRIYAATYSIDTWSKEDIAIVKWNGTKWDTVAKGITGTGASVSGSASNAHVNDIAVYGDTLYVAGAFSKAGTKNANGIAKWNGTSWDSLGEGTTGELTNVEIDSLGRVYAAGRMSPAKVSNGADAIGRWDGKKWERLGSGITKPQYFQGSIVHDMKIVGSRLFLCGDFKEPGGIASTGIVMYDIAASRWKALNGRNTNGFDAAVFAYHETSKGEIFAGGEFSYAGPAYARRLAKWNGKTWDSVGTGAFNNSSVVRAIASDDSVVYIGGSFSSFNGVNSNGVIKWNGQRFVSMNNPTQTGTAATNVRVLTRYGSDLMIAGNFQTFFGTFPNAKAVNSIIKWNGTKYDSLDIGIRNGSSTGTINTMIVQNSNLYVAGNFTTAGTVAASSVAKWNGSAWSALNGDVIRFNKSAATANITAMVFVGNDLYIAGRFDSIGTKPMWHLAKWNGTQWDSVSLAFKGNSSGIADMAVDKSGRLYVVGNFNSLGGDANKRYVVRWNGSAWESLGDMTSSFSQDMYMAESDPKGNIYMSGYFGFVNGFSSQNFAAWINDPGAIESVRRLDAVGTPEVFSLSQNYPNPFNPTTTIRFELRQGGPVALKVYDVVGREIATLLQGRLAEGSYETSFDASALPSGLYFYRMQSGEYMMTKKMLLVR